MEYQRIIFENSNIRLLINFTGITDDIAIASDLKCHFYAIEKPSFRQVFHETLSIDNIRELFTQLNAISIIRDPAKNVSKRFIESSPDISELIESFERVDKKSVAKLLEKLAVSDKIEAILETLSNTELHDLEAAYKQKSHREEIDNLEKLIDLDMSCRIVNELDSHENLIKYKAGQPEKIFQNWIESNLWIFGVEYMKKHNFRKISFFSEGDLLMESNDGYLDLIELKRPKLEYEVFKYDVSHKSYYPSSDLSKVLGQCLFYQQKIDEAKHLLETEYKIKVLRPRVKIVLGRSNNFNEYQTNALRMLNSGLNNIDIITYDNLIENGKKIITSYRK